MGLMKRVKNSPRPNLRNGLKSIQLRRRKQPAAVASTALAAQPGNSTKEDQATPIEEDCAFDSAQFFDWVTNKMDGFNIASIGTAVDGVLSMSTGDNSTATDPAKPSGEKPSADNSSPDMTDAIGWMWLTSCWGSPYLINKADDPTSVCSDDDSGESSWPSVSRLDQMLEFKKTRPSDISDITSACSLDTGDDSDSENGNNSDSEDENDSDSETENSSLGS